MIVIFHQTQKIVKSSLKVFNKKNYQNNFLKFIGF